MDYSIADKNPFRSNHVSYSPEMNVNLCKEKKILFVTCLDVTRAEGKLLAEMSGNSLEEVVWVSLAEAFIKDYYDSVMRSILLSLYKQPIEYIHVVGHKKNKITPITGNQLVKAFQKEHYDSLMISQTEMEDWLNETTDMTTAIQQSVYTIRSYPLYPENIPIQGWIIDTENDIWKVVEKPIIHFSF